MLLASTQAEVAIWGPLGILALGMAVVLVMIMGLKINAFISLITGAMLVSLLAPGKAEEKIQRVAEAFGSNSGKIAVVIALAAVIGQAMMDSGAADRIVRGFLRLLGQKRSPWALMASGYVLSIPVFFDTVFFLLVPLARSFYRRTGKNYLLCLVAITAGGAITHSLVPPTPGPLTMAATLGIDLGVMILVGALIALPCAVVGLLVGRWLDLRWPVPLRELDGEQPQTVPDDQLPPLWASLLPVVLPVVLIACHTTASTLADPEGRNLWAQVVPVTAILGNPNLALLLATAVAVGLYLYQLRPTAAQFARMTERSLMTGGLIILITAAGASFGAMLKQAQVGQAIQGLFQLEPGAGLGLILLGFGIASLLKVAQGSSTAAMIITSAMLADMVAASPPPFHVVYLATAIGCGSLVGGWMNDSGFWVFAKMGGLTEAETLRSWTVILAVLGITGLVTTIVLSQLMPLATNYVG